MSADGAVEDIETFRVILEVPGEESGVVLGVDTAVVTIINNDSKQNFTRECVISLSISLSLLYSGFGGYSIHRQEGRN